MIFNMSWSLIILFALVCIVMNIFIYVVGWNGIKMYTAYKHNKLIPPGFVIGIIWVVIFSLLGYAFYLLYSGPPSDNNPRGWTAGCILLMFTAGYCLLYPIITMIFENKYVSLFNFIGLLFAIALAVVALTEYEAAFWYVLPLLVWTSYIVFVDIITYFKNRKMENKEEMKDIMVLPKISSVYMK